MRTSPTSSPSSCNAQRLRRTASSLIAVGGNSLVIRLLLSGLLGRLDSLLRGRRGLGRLFGVLVLFIILNRLLGVVLVALLLLLFFLFVGAFCFVASGDVLLLLLAVVVLGQGDKLLLFLAAALRHCGCGGVENLRSSLQGRGLRKV